MEFSIGALSFLAVVINIIFLVMACRYSVGSTFIFSVLQLSFCFIFIVPRIVNFIFFPESVYLLYSTKQYFYNSQIVTDSFVAKALMINLIGMAGACAGFTVGSKFFAKKTCNLCYAPKYPSFNIWITFFSIILILRSDGLLAAIHSGLNLNNFIEAHNFVVLIGILTNPEVFLMLMVLPLIQETKYFNENLWKVILVGSMYVAIKGLGGSRAGPLMLFIYFGIGTLFFLDNAALNKKKFVLFMIATSFLGLSSYEWATNNRLDAELSIPKKQVLEVHEKYVVNPFNRLGAYTDALIVTSNYRGNEKVAAEYLTLSYALKSAINISLPGQYFDCCMVNSSIASNFIFSNKDVSMLEGGEVSETGLYSFFGLAFYKTGYIGLVVTAVSGAFLFALGLSFIRSRESLQPFLVVFVSLTYFQGMQMIGVDAFLADFVKFTFAALFLYFTIVLASNIFSNNKT